MTRIASLTVSLLLIVATRAPAEFCNSVQSTLTNNYNDEPCSGDPATSSSHARSWNVTVTHQCLGVMDQFPVNSYGTGACGHATQVPDPACPAEFQEPYDSGYSHTYGAQYVSWSTTNVVWDATIQGCRVSHISPGDRSVSTPDCTPCQPPAPCTSCQPGGSDCEPDACGTVSTFYCDQSTYTCQVWTPIVIDVAGDGFNLTDRAVLFDTAGDGRLVSTGWTSAGSDDAFLVLDRNGNGRVDNGTELFGNATPQPEPPPGTPKNGFLALAEYDKSASGGNEDGRIESADATFSSLRLWRDANHNGISEASELRSLESAGITAIELRYTESRRRDRFGNRFRYRARVVSAPSAPVGRWAWDVIFVRGRP